MTDPKPLEERLREMVPSGQWTIGSAYIGVDSLGDSTPSRPIMRFKNPDGPEAATELTALRTQIAALREAITTFLAKYDECEPHINAASLHHYLHVGPYTGPQYGEELEALRAVLEGAPKL